MEYSLTIFLTAAAITATVTSATAAFSAGFAEAIAPTYTNLDWKHVNFSSNFTFKLKQN
jgi:hypothetical protein